MAGLAATQKMGAEKSDIGGKEKVESRARESIAKWGTGRV